MLERTRVLFGMAGLSVGVTGVVGVIGATGVTGFTGFSLGLTSGFAWSAGFSVWFLNKKT